MDITTLSKEQRAHVLKKIKELQTSDGWSILKQIMKHEQEVFWRKLSAPTSTLDPQLMNYNRGIIEGTYRLSTLPDNISSAIENDARMESLTVDQPTEP